MLGNGLFFTNDEGPNVKLSYDGFRVLGSIGSTNVNVLAVKPVDIKPGFFDDVPQHQESIWSVYATIAAPLVSGGRSDIYYIDDDMKNATFNRGTARAIRHTVGARLFRVAGRRWDYSWEPNLQAGTFGALRLRAWAVSTETGYTFAEARMQPRLLLRSDAYSGDGGSPTHVFGTFSAGQFSNGWYFSPKLGPVFAPQNLVDCHPILQLHVKRNLTAEASWDWYWRESGGDGVYIFGSGQLLAPASIPGRFLGQQGDAEVRWSPYDHTIVAFNVFGLLPGTFINNTPAHGTTFAVNVGMTYRF
ncbi:MAG: alginate export family protein [Acidobacteriota bacterium]|nr:alginate export family protein [Acidobacteriota bacterium]